MAYEGITRLNESLDATGVISKDYRNVVMGWAYLAVSEAYDSGRRSEMMRWLAAGQTWRRKGDGRVAVIHEVVNVGRSGPAYVVMWLDAGESEAFTVNQDELVRDWTRQT